MGLRFSKSGNCDATAESSRTSVTDHWWNVWDHCPVESSNGAQAYAYDMFSPGIF